MTKKLMLSPATMAAYHQVGFLPTKAQTPILECTKRYVLVSGGEQAGKSLVASKKWLDRWLDDVANLQACPVPSRCEPSMHPYGGTCDPTLLYWLVGADYAQTEKEFEYIRDDLALLSLPIRSTKGCDPGLIELHYPDERRPRLRIETRTAREPQKLARSAPHGIIGCEAGMLDLATFNRLRGRTAPKQGWLFLIGTIEKASSWYPRLQQQWASGALEDRTAFTLPSYTNTYLYPGGANDPEILALKAEASDDFFMERIEGKPVPPEGLVFPEARAEIHVRECEYVPGSKVYIWEDPGYGAASAHAIEAAQIIDGQVRVFDEIYERGLITREIIEMCMTRDWWKSRDKLLVSDPNYKDAHHSMTSVAEEWMRMTGLYALGDRVRINEGTERLKGFLKPDPLTKNPRIVFSPRCRGILSELGLGSNPHNGQMQAYVWKLDNNGMPVGDTPADRFNHGIKAVIYGLVEHFGKGYAGRRTAKVKVW